MAVAGLCAMAWRDYVSVGCGRCQAMVLLPALLCLGACQEPRPKSTSPPGHLPQVGILRLTLPAPSPERPSWLPGLPSDMPRFRMPDDEFLDDLV